MKKLTKTTALILSTLMLFGCTDNSTQSGVGDTTPPSESSVTDSKTDSKNESSATENSSETDNSSNESKENLVKNIDGYQTFSYDENKYENFTEIEYTQHYYGVYDRAGSSDPTKKENMKANNRSSIGIKCRVVGDSYYVHGGVCGNVKITKEEDDYIFTPVIIEEIVEDFGNESVFSVGDIIYVREWYRPVEEYNTKTPKWVEEQIEYIKQQYEDENGNFNSSYFSEENFEYYKKQLEYYDIIGKNPEKYVVNLCAPVMMQRGQSYLVFAENVKTPNEIDGNIYCYTYNIIFDLENDAPYVDQSEEMVKNLYRCGACYQNQWKILKEKYGEHFKK